MRVISLFTNRRREGNDNRPQRGKSSKPIGGTGPTGGTLLLFKLTVVTIMTFVEWLMKFALRHRQAIVTSNQPAV